MSNVGMVIKAIIYTSPEPITGYEITKQIKNKTGNQHQQVYRELGKLADRDDVIVEKIAQSEKPDKKVYKFAPDNNFSVDCKAESDYSKTALAYGLLLNDVMYGTDLYDEYMNLMQNVEKEFYLKNADKMLLEPLAQRVQDIKASELLVDEEDSLFKEF